MAKVRYAEGFVEDVVEKVEQPAKVAQIRAACNLLADFPEMGSPLVRASIRSTFGASVRTLPASPFVIVYEYLKELDEVRILGLMHAKQVR